MICDTPAALVVVVVTPQVSRVKASHSANLNAPNGGFLT
jgi:hypothetical protein